MEPSGRPCKVPCCAARRAADLRCEPTVGPVKLCIEQVRVAEWQTR